MTHDEPTPPTPPAAPRPDALKVSQLIERLSVAAREYGFALGRSGDEHVAICRGEAGEARRALEQVVLATPPSPVPVVSDAAVEALLGVWFPDGLEHIHLARNNHIVVTARAALEAAFAQMQENNHAGH